MSSINATAGSALQPTALIRSADNTSTLTFQTNSIDAVSIASTQIANFTSTGAIILPSGTTAQQPTGANVSNGMMRYNTDNASLEAYLTNIWVPIAYGPYTVEYLIVAGGGGGGFRVGGGGGAGGVLSGNASVVPNTVYSFAVGNGGAAGVGNGGNGGNGGNSTAFTFTAVGGGGGMALGGTAGNGGSGGGSAYISSVVGTGIAGQGNNGGSAYTLGASYGGGGGGGAGAVGSNGTNTNGGNGGIGIASSITGSSVYYAGGGGGGITASGGGAGGNGGGANGGNNAVGGNATANTGGGGGGGGDFYNGGTGGSGVVIVSVPTAKYTGFTTGSPTITTSGSNTILKYTASGTYTA